MEAENWKRTARALVAANKDLSGQNSYLRVRLRAAEARVAELEEGAKRAISTPPNALPVLGWIDPYDDGDGYWTICWYSRQANMWFTDIGGNNTIRPTHWQRLPPGPSAARKTTEEPTDD